MSDLSDQRSQTGQRRNKLRALAEKYAQQGKTKKGAQYPPV